MTSEQEKYLTNLISKEPKSEVQLQNKCVEALQLFYPAESKRLVCVNNNDKHTNKLNIGIVDGASDTYWLADKGKTLYIEFKFGNNKQSKNQIEWQQLCVSLGHEYVLCYTYDKFWELICFKQPELSDFKPQTNFLTNIKYESSN